MKKNKFLFDQLSQLTTEQSNKRSGKIDTLDSRRILTLINREDKRVAGAVGKEIAAISGAVDLVVKSFRAGGRLIYAGAGTSGRLGILDASECPPTFGIKPLIVQGIIAGGKKAAFVSQEGAEDRMNDGRRDVRLLSVNKNDVVCGIAASMRTPYVIGALAEAKHRGAKTLFVTTNPRAKLRQKQFANLRKLIDVAICPVVGPEVIMGSTRMKSGTAQKLVLNMITTTSMIRLGKVYKNMMVDLKLNSKKLEERAKRVIMVTTGVEYNTASKVLKKSNGHVKTAIVMIASHVTVAEAGRRLKKANGFVRHAINNKSFQR
jgi:N-acetylmuramic acid 6-phosphate etherase